MNSIQDSNTETGIIFIHGAGLGGWIWDDVVKDISVPYVLADYASLERLSNKATLADYVDTVYEQAKRLDTNRVVIVAHSIGGVIGIELSKKMKDKLAAFVGISASIPKPNSNFVSTLPFPQKLLMPIIIKIAGTRPPESAIRNGLGNGLRTDQVAQIISTFQPESARIYTDRISSDSMPDVPALYLRTTNDKEFAVSIQNASIANLNNPTVFDIDAGHLPMLSDAATISRRINDLLKTIQYVEA
jgi:pimeloyl-ACP methyl ester carboxylesterase